MINDAAMIRRCGSWRTGFDPSLDLDAATLARVTAPVHVLVGTDDPVGGRDVGRRLASLLPAASLEVWDGAGHLPWYDDPARFAASFAAFRSTGRSPTAR
jgi:pimeloyl-ACP methyl ester carboxylesterase